MKWLEVKKSTPLKGSVKIPGSKNSSLGLLAACCLTDEIVTLENIPDILDIKLVCNIGKDIGMEIQKFKNRYVINPSAIHSTDIDPEKSASYRAAYYFTGALLAKHKIVRSGYPGGDKIGPRPIDQHIKGLKAMGVDFEFHNDHYIAKADKLTGADIYFDVITSGATINLMLAAVLAKGRTTLHNAARDPEVVDIAVFLNKMGARIFGAGTDTIRIDGVEGLGGCTHSTISDRLIAGAFLIAAVATEGRITVEDIIPEHLDACVDKLAEIGAEIEKGGSSITVTGKPILKATRVRTGMYPVFVSDLQQPITALLLKAKGRSFIADRIYPGRFNHCEQLARMGASITARNGVAVINGSQPLKGTWVHASDIRAGTCLILAGLCAEGTTCITGVEHVERGYENITEVFASLGSSIKLCSDGSEEKVKGKAHSL